MTDRASDRARMRIAAALGAEGTDPDAPGMTPTEAALFALSPVAGRAIGALGPRGLAALVGGYAVTTPNEATPQSQITRGQQRELEMRRRQQELEDASRQRQMEADAAIEATRRRNESSIAIEAERARAEQERIQRQLERELTEKIALEERNKTFLQKYPGIADQLSAVGLLAGAIVPAAGRVVSQRARNAPMREWHATLKDTEAALGRTSFGGAANPNIQRASEGIEKLAEFNRKYPKGSPKAERELPYYMPSRGLVASGMFGGSVAAESAMFPDQWNAINLPEGHPEKELSRARALDPMEYIKRGAMGALSGASAYKGAKLMTPDRTGPLPQSQGLVNRYGGSPDRLGEQVISDAVLQQQLRAVQRGTQPRAPAAGAGAPQPNPQPAGPAPQGGPPQGGPPQQIAGPPNRGGQGRGWGGLTQREILEIQDAVKDLARRWGL